MIQETKAKENVQLETTLVARIIQKVEGGKNENISMPHFRVENPIFWNVVSSAGSQGLHWIPQAIK